MEKILQFQEAFGSLIDIAPEPKKVKRKTHNIKLLYDIHNSDVSSAWADSIYEISKSYDNLVESESYHNQFKLFKNYLKPYEHKIELGSGLSLKEISALVNEYDEHCNQSRLKDFKKLEVNWKLTNE